ALADDANHNAALHDLAMLTNRLHAGTYLQDAPRKKCSEQTLNLPGGWSSRNGSRCQIIPPLSRTVNWNEQLPGSRPRSRFGPPSWRSPGVPDGPVPGRRPG